MTVVETLVIELLPELFQLHLGQYFIVPLFLASESNNLVVVSEPCGICGICCLNLLSLHCLCLRSSLQCQNQWLTWQLQCQTCPYLPTSRTTSPPCSKEKLVTNCLFQRIKTCSRCVSTNRKVNKKQKLQSYL